MTTTSSDRSPAHRRTDVEPLLSIRNLVVEYRTGPKSTVQAVRGIDLELYPGESMALVGESGCGKTTFGLGLLRLLPKLGSARGEVLFRSRDGATVDVLQLEGEDLRRFRWNEAAMVFQGAMNAFNPVTRIRTHMEDTLKAHGRYSKSEVEDKASELLRLVRLEPKRVMDSYPHELSGGMRQRVLIAMSLLLDPQVLVLDEPTTALDILTQRSIVDVLHDIRDRLKFAMIFISHDLALAAELADRVSTMYAGRIIERGSVRDLFYRPRHPYSLALINAVPPVIGDLPTMESIPGGPPSLAALPSGCSFHPRCRFARDDCTGVEPPLEPVARGEGSDVGHEVACYHYDEVHLDRTGRASVADLAKVLGPDAIRPGALAGDAEGSTS
jgi:peptide/nickel transport system ATP-binding protein